MIYLDNAATSFPKPPEVSRAIMEYMVNIGANPGRSGYETSAEAARIVNGTRSSLAELFNAGDPRQVVFTRNATESINLVLNGFLVAGDEVIATGMEHNAVMRPLRHLESSRGICIRLAGCDGSGRINLEGLKDLISKRTRLVVVNHASNVTGTIQPLSDIGAIAGEIPVLVDAAQTAGALSIDVMRDNISFLAFTGHKSLLGPQGTGGIYIREELAEKLEPLIRGGTGSKSQEEYQPEILPDKFEAGTMNTAGVAGLGAAVSIIRSHGVSSLHKREFSMTERLLNGLEEIDGIHIYGPGAVEDRMPVVSFTIDNLDNAEVGHRLAREFSIACRAGLHCAPRAHATLGTAPAGTVRLSPGYYTTEEEIDMAVHAVASIAAGEGK